MGTKKEPAGVKPVNRIGTLEYIVRIPIKGSLSVELTLTEFKYLSEAYQKFAKQGGFKGF